MSNRINTYYILEDQFINVGVWDYVDRYARLSGVLADIEIDSGCPMRIVRYARNRIPEVVRQWDADGKRIV